MHNTDRQDMLFAKTYFLTLALTVVIVAVNLAYGNFIPAFYLPFVIGGAGSFLLYIVKRHSNAYQVEQLKLICHSFCSVMYIVGAFVLLVFFNVGLLPAWSYHIWLIPTLIVAALNFKQHISLFVLVLFIFIALFVLDLDGLPGSAVSAIAMGSFWGLAFYFLMGFWNDIKKIYVKNEGNKNDAT